LGPGPNSGVYVPALLAAAGLLHEDAQATWFDHPVAGQWWPALVPTLAQAPAVEPWDFFAILVGTLEKARDDPEARGYAASVQAAERFRDAVQRTPNGGHGQQMHLRWLLELLVEPNGYIPAQVQEAAFLAFGGERLASSAATLANTLRRPWPPDARRPSERQEDARRARLLHMLDQMHLGAENTARRRSARPGRENAPPAATRGRPRARAAPATRAATVAARRRRS